MADSIGNAINNWIGSLLKDVIKWIIGILKATVGLIDDNMNQVGVYYALFLGVALSLMIAVVLARVISTLLKQADDTTDVTWDNIVMDAIKASMSIPIMVFIQGFLLRSVTIPLLKFSFSESQGLTFKAIEHASKVASGNGHGYGQGVPILILLFFAVVIVVFFIKIGIFMADIAFFNISIPIVGVSVASENFEYASTWWKKLLYLNLTIIAQSIAMSLMVASFALLDKGWGYLAFTIGFGVLTIKAPTILQDLWQSTGTGKSTVSTGMRMASMAMMRR